MINNFFYSYNTCIRVYRAQNIKNRIWPKRPTLHLQPAKMSVAKMSVAKTSWPKRPGQNVRGQNARGQNVLNSFFQNSKIPLNLSSIQSKGLDNPSKIKRSFENSN